MKIRIAVCLIACLLNCSVHAHAEVGVLIDLARREMHFDFCGPECSQGIVPERIGVSSNRIATIHQYGYSDIAFRERRLAVLARLEKCMKHNHSLAECRGEIDEVRNLLSGIAKNAKNDFMDRYRLADSIEKVEYLLARVLERGRSDLLTGDVIMSILPDEVFDTPHDSLRRDFLKFKRFRDLLLVGIDIRELERQGGMASVKRVDADRVIARANVSKGWQILFSTDGKIWQLQYVNQDSPRVDPPFDVYVPLLRGHPVFRWPGRNEVSLSSDFSAKRAMLYHRGRINDNTPWECILREDGVEGPLRK